MSDISPKDPLLKGIYVRRCKCGDRPHLDRLWGLGAWWLTCYKCKNTCITGDSIESAAENWNAGLMNPKRDY